MVVVVVVVVGGGSGGGGDRRCSFGRTALTVTVLALVLVVANMASIRHHASFDYHKKVESHLIPL